MSLDLAVTSGLEALLPLVQDTGGLYPDATLLPGEVPQEDAQATTEDFAALLGLVLSPPSVRLPEPVGPGAPQQAREPRQGALTTILQPSQAAPGLVENRSSGADRLELAPTDGEAPAVPVVPEGLQKVRPVTAAPQELTIAVAAGRPAPASVLPPLVRPEAAAEGELVLQPRVVTAAVAEFEASQVRERLSDPVSSARWLPVAAVAAPSSGPELAARPPMVPEAVRQAVAQRVLQVGPQATSQVMPQATLQAVPMVFAASVLPPDRAVQPVVDNKLAAGAGQSVVKAPSFMTPARVLTAVADRPQAETIEVRRVVETGVGPLSTEPTAAPVATPEVAPVLQAAAVQAQAVVAPTLVPAITPPQVNRVAQLIARQLTVAAAATPVVTPRELSAPVAAPFAIEEAASGVKATFSVVRDAAQHPPVVFAPKPEAVFTRYVELPGQDALQPKRSKAAAAVPPVAAVRMENPREGLPNVQNVPQSPQVARELPEPEAQVIRERVTALPPATETPDEVVHQVRLTLTPPDLGAVTLRIETRGHEVTTQVIVDRVVTGEVLRQAESQVRQLLHEQGLQMGSYEVDYQQPQHRQPPQPQELLPPQARLTPNPPPRRERPAARENGVDVFA